MQLSMAVNNALANVSKRQKYFVTEPNRIPLAGELKCLVVLDKTGTLCADTFLLTCAVTYKQGDNTATADEDSNNNK
eukprot:UN05864